MRTFRHHALTDQQRAYHVARRQMVDEQLRSRGIVDPRVLQIMQEIPRHLFVEEGLSNQAYCDRPLPIGFGQTISQPYMVAYMSEQLQLHGTERILEIGTGCGYQTAVLCALGASVFSIERLAPLSHQARRHLYDLGLVNFQLRIGDGTLGWPDAAPFDGIIVTAGGPTIPQTYLDQLAEGGRLIIPVGSAENQSLVRVTRRGRRWTQESLTECRFVRLIGRHGFSDA